MFLNLSLAVQPFLHVCMYSCLKVSKLKIVNKQNFKGLQGTREHKDTMKKTENPAGKWTDGRAEILLGRSKKMTQKPGQIITDNQMQVCEVEMQVCEVETH